MADSYGDVFAPDVSPSAPVSLAKIGVLVIDTIAFIRLVHVERMAERVYTVPEVISEVRDSKAREFLDRLPMEVVRKSPSPAALQAVLFVELYVTLSLVTDFAKLTGDYASLSLTDLKVIALTYQLDVEANGSAEHLRKSPELVRLSEDDVNKNFFNPLATTKKEADDDSSNEDDDYPEESSSDEPESAPEVLGVGAFEEGDDSGWITPDNVEDYSKAYMDTTVSAADVTPKVACLTGDFAMQNVLLQMNLNLVSLEGLRIKSAKKWVLRCYGCLKLCLKIEEQFCPHCGQHTLEKVAYSVDSNGQATYTLSRKTRNLRGKIYPIPKPKGRKGNIIVSQGQAKRPKRRQNQKQYSDEDVLGARSRPQEDFVFGYGKQNPNVARRKFGKKNKSKRKD